MAIIGNIGGVPIFDKKEEALVWGKRNNLTGHHTHIIAGKTGYMGGSDHVKAVQAVTSITTPTPAPVPPTPTLRVPTPTPTLRVPPPPTGSGGY